VLQKYFDMVTVSKKMRSVAVNSVLELSYIQGEEKVNLAG